MTKQEFEKIANAKVTESEYELIELVYTWYPTISNTTGKQEIAAIYNAGGIRVIKDMRATAVRAREIDSAILCEKARIRELQKELDELSE